MWKRKSENFVNTQEINPSHETCKVISSFFIQSPITSSVKVNSLYVGYHLQFGAFIQFRENLKNSTHQIINFFNSHLQSE